MSKIKYLLQRYTFFFFYIINSKLNYKILHVFFQNAYKTEFYKINDNKKIPTKIGIFYNINNNVYT